MSIYRIFSQILNMSLIASIVILIVLAARLLLKKTPKIFSYALWAVVLFRLLCPVSLPSKISLFNAFETPITSKGNIAYTTFLNTTNLLDEQLSPTRIPESNMTENTAANLDTNLVGNQTQANKIETDSKVTPLQAGAYIWLAGIAVMLVYSIVSLMKLRRRLVGAVKVRDNIYLADHIASPFVLGLFRPGIYLPSTLSEQEQDYIIQHEQHHIRRFDHVVKIIAFAALCIHWFNPLVWIAFVLAGNDMEMSCDEAVMKKMGNDIRADYSTSLLTLATGKKMITGTPLAFGAGNTKGRIKNVMSYKKPAFWAGIAAAVCLVIVSTVLIFNPKDETEPAYDIAVDFLTEYYERSYTGKEKDLSVITYITSEINNEQEGRIAERQQIMKATGGYVKDLKLSFEQAEYEEREGKVILTVNMDASFQYPNVEDESGFGGKAVFEISKQDENYVISGCSIQDTSGDYIFGEFDGVPSLRSYAVYKMKTSEKGTSLKSGRYAPELRLYSDRTFEFSYKPTSSDTPRGVYSIEDNVLTATSNRTYTYVFEVADENALRFVQNASSDVSDINEEFAIPIADGAEFELTISQPINWNEQPESKISVTASERHPNYAAIIHQWDGNVYKYDTTDVFMWSRMSSAGTGPVYVSEGDTIEIEFLEKVPESYELTAEIMNKSGEKVPEDLRKTVPITFENGKGSFVFSISDMEGAETAEEVGYRLTCRWGENECEYGFVVYLKK